MMSYYDMLSAVAIGYVIGSIPFGLLLAQLAGIGDIRKIGSGNIGTTNVLRTGSKKLAALTLLFDAGKGAFALWLVVVIAAGSDNGGNILLYIAAFAALVGHMFPLWLKFRGGKGVATYIGILLMLMPQLAAVFLLTWVAIFALMRISSLAAISAVIVVVIYGCAVFADIELFTFTAISGILILLRHKDNIYRLLRGEEAKLKL